MLFAGYLLSESVHPLFSDLHQTQVNSVTKKRRITFERGNFFPNAYILRETAEQSQGKKCNNWQQVQQVIVDLFRQILPLELTKPNYELLLTTETCFKLMYRFWFFCWNSNMKLNILMRGCMMYAVCYHSALANNANTAQISHSTQICWKIS